MKKEEQNGGETKQEPMELEEKKVDIKAEAKEEEEAGANGAVASYSPTQSRRKSEYNQLHTYLDMVDMFYIGVG